MKTATFCLLGKKETSPSESNRHARFPFSRSTRTILSSIETNYAWKLLRPLETEGLQAKKATSGSEGRAAMSSISAGTAIGPFEVESLLIEHEAVVESAVVSSPDASEERLTKELQDHVKQATGLGIVSIQEKWSLCRIAKDGQREDQKERIAQEGVGEA
uniref:Uncharacterized protein n=1 Tax=Sphaerodactylus townsendi TaxID=933632 RepID=A0ACB8FKR5_9SAUR